MNRSLTPPKHKRISNAPCGTDHELSSVGFTIANGSITAGLKVFIFLSSSGVDLLRKRAADTTQVNPLEPLAKLINDFMVRGGTIWACTPCVKSRGYARAAENGPSCLTMVRC